MAFMAFSRFNVSHKNLEHFKMTGDSTWILSSILFSQCRSEKRVPKESQEDTTNSFESVLSRCFHSAIGSPVPLHWLLSCWLGETMQRLERVVMCRADANKKHTQTLLRWLVPPHSFLWAHQPGQPTAIRCTNSTYIIVIAAKLLLSSDTRAVGQSCRTYGANSSNSYQLSWSGNLQHSKSLTKK